MLFYQGNSPAHEVAVSMADIREMGFEMLELWSYSSDLAPADFYLFARLKERPRGAKFEDDSAVFG